MKNAAAFTAEKLNSLGLSTADIKQHHDWTGKNCPRILIDKAYIKEGLDWAYFLKEAEKNMEKAENTLTLEEAKKIIQKKCGLDSNTMLYLDMYRYADSLIIRIAEQMI